MAVWSQVTRSLTCHVEEFGLCSEDDRMPLKGFKPRATGTNDPVFFGSWQEDGLAVKRLEAERLVGRLMSWFRRQMVGSALGQWPIEIKTGATESRIVIEDRKDGTLHF